MSDAFSACEEDVRRHDPDRYYAALFAPEAGRRHLFALIALYRELAHAVEAAREPMIVDIRLAWWRETIEGARAGNPRDHLVAKALAETLAVHDLPAKLFDRIIDARAGEAGAGPFASAGEAERHAEATCGTLLALAARVLGAEADAAAHEAGIAYALAGRQGGRYPAIDTAALARSHLAAARAIQAPREALPALLPAALVPLYLKRRDPPLWRKQVALLHAAMRGRI